MNTRDLDRIDWDEDELTELVAKFVRSFHRLPSGGELVRFRNRLAELELRVPAARRRIWARRRSR